MDSFQALWANNSDQNIDDWTHIQCELKKTKLSELSEGEVLIETHYSSVNFKDALAVTGRGKILRNLPLIPGIDVSGVVAQSTDPQFKEGDPVIVQGCDNGEVRNGGYSEFVRVPSQAVIPLPQKLSLRESMIYGTAGFTAGLALHRMEINGLEPSKGKVLVTGATGGVGSISLQFLNKKGYTSEAWTRKKDKESWLKKMGAHKVIDISTKDFKTAPMASAEWAGAIDNVGDDILSYIIARMDLWGSIASIGLAKSPKLNSSVFPFILRGVNLLGVSSNNCPQGLRREIWQRLAEEYKPEDLESLVTSELNLNEIPAFCKKMIAGQSFGRAIVSLKV